MKIEGVTLRQVRLPFVHFFETSFGRVSEKEGLLVEVQSEGISGWGECAAAEGPFYSYESVHTAWEILDHFLVPRVKSHPIEKPEDFLERVRSVRGHPMAKASLEGALWDWKARAAGLPLWRLLGGTRDRIVCGVSIGIQDQPRDLLQRIEAELRDGYHKIKIKIKPGWDVEVARLVRRHFPEIQLMVDANSAYTLQDSDHLLQLDELDLLMIEQPLYYDDIMEHSQLQARLETPICLDESIRHRRDARQAIELEACRIVNIKPGRVGGLSEAVHIHNLCQEKGVPVWCGGMLETGIGRAHNVALSTLENFSIPGDVSASRRYFQRDTVQPPVEVNREGYIIPPFQPGIGYEPDLEWIEEITVRKKVF